MTQIKELGDQELRSIFVTLCDLCGYPRLQDDKFITLSKFTRYHFGNEKPNVLVNAFDQLAVGNLDEKLDQNKSLTPMVLSRVYDSYRRNNMNKPGEDELLTTEQGEKVQRYPLNPTSQQILKEKTNRTLFWSDQVTEHDEHILMQHYTDEAKMQFNETGHAFAITDGMFDFMEKDGKLRFNNGNLEYFSGEWLVVCPWDNVIERAKRIYESEKGTPRSALRRNKQNGEPMRESTEKRAAMVEYFNYMK